MKTPAQRRRDLKRERAKRAAFKAAGLRCDGKPLAPAKPCGCKHGCCLKCSRPGNRHYHSDEKIAALWAAVQAGKKAWEIEREFKLGRGSLRDILKRRGYELPRTPHHPAHDPVTGRIKPWTPHTPAQITAAIRKLKRVMVPPELKLEWKHRPMRWRMQLIRRIRKFLPNHCPRPTTPFSKNVTPFEYGTPAAMNLVARLNRGRTSQTKVTHLRPCTQGVIYAGRLWFWAHRNDGREAGARYTEMGPPPRRALHHVIYEQHHGPIPAQHTVIFRDGNKNNFAPRNLALRSMADCARLNCPHRGLQGAARAQWFEKIARTRAATMARQARAKTAALLQAGEFAAALAAGSRSGSGSGSKSTFNP